MIIVSIMVLPSEKLTFFDKLVLKILFKVTLALDELEISVDQYQTQHH